MSPPRLLEPPGRQLIGIAYAARVGKDTAADSLVRDLQFRKFAFADELKNLAMECDPVVLPEPGRQNVNIGHNRLAHIVRWEGGFERAKDRYPEVRRFLENLGMGVRKQFGDDFWCDLVMRRAAHAEKAVISDVRFINEFTKIAEAGGKLIKIVRPGHEPRPFEAELHDIPDEDWDLVVNNAGSVVDLEQAVVSFVKAAYGPKAKKAAA